MGFIHPLLEPAHLVALITLILLIGQQGLQQTRSSLFALSTSTGAGLLFAAVGWPLTTHVPLLACAAAAGVAVALGRVWPRAACATAAVLIGLFIGSGSAPDGPLNAGAVLALLGTCVWVINGSGLVEALQRPWMQVLVRVVASWMAACDVLFLALSIAPRRGASSAAPGLPGLRDVGR